MTWFVILFQCLEILLKNIKTENFKWKDNFATEFGAISSKCNYRQFLTFFLNVNICHLKYFSNFRKYHKDCFINTSWVHECFHHKENWLMRLKLLLQSHKKNLDLLLFFNGVKHNIRSVNRSQRCHMLDCLSWSRNMTMTSTLRCATKIMRWPSSTNF